MDVDEFKCSSQESDAGGETLKDLHLALKEMGYTEDLTSLSKLECIRLKNVLERNALLKSMGFNPPVPRNDKIIYSDSKPKIKIASAKKRKETDASTPIRKSLRLQNIPVQNFSEEVIVEPVEIKDERNKDKIDLLTENETCKNLLYDLSKLKSITSECSFDIASCSQYELAQLMASVEIKPDHIKKVVKNRIQSVLVHGSIEKRLAFCGSTSGTLGMWDIDSDLNEASAEIEIQKGAVNCLSICQEKPTNIYSTSFDGTFCCVDFSSHKVFNVYATDFDDRVNHLTWHNQLGPSKFLLAHGNGSVLVLDSRVEVPKVRVINCFARSVRTVQVHPQDDNYFLVSSGIGECSIFDQRNSARIHDFPHPKSLTSAFFSSSDNKVLTTCSDDKVRIFSFKSWADEKPKLSKVINHNNFTGRWLSVFKAKWLPGRSDVFHIGSLLHPRQIQFYTEKGENLFNLEDENMATVQSVIDMHPSIPFVVSGNSSGKLHVFTSSSQSS